MHEPIPEQGRWSGPVVRGYFAYHCEGQEDHLGALGLVVNIIVLWNTLYVDAILQQLRTEGFPVPPEATCWGGMPFRAGGGSTWGVTAASKPSDSTEEVA